MPKILAVSDIHIHDYPQRNPSEKFRLYQTRVVSQNILDVAKREGAEILVLAGDIFEKSVVRPYILAETKLFLDTLMSFFKEGYIIWGNHDNDSRSTEQHFIDSGLSVMLPPNLHYSDCKQYKIGSSIVGFSNWKPKFDLSWINGKLDVLFTHATISYYPGDLYQSQELDESKFELAICGDIHRPANKGKYVSIGIPQKCKMSDSDESTGVIYDTETKTWGWVNLNPYDNLLKFQYTSIPENEGYIKDTNTWLVYKPDNINKINNGISEIKIPAWEEVGALIDNIIIQNGLEIIHSEVLKNCKNLEAQEVDFNFRLTRFYCKNWRSIEEVELFFNEADKILIRGKNGSGKSSLLSALKYAFVENRFIKDFIQFGSKECITEVDFLYQGKMHRIQRGSKKWGLLVEGEPIKYGSKKEFEEDMHRRFPFIDYIDVYFFDEDHLKLIGDITPERKSELVSKFFRLDRIDYFNQIAQELLTELKKSVQSWQEQYDNSSRLKMYIEDKLNSIQLPNNSIEELIASKERGIELQKKYQEYAKYISQVSERSGRLEMLNMELVKTIQELNNLPQRIQLEISLGDIEQRMEELKGQEISLRAGKESYIRIKQELDRITNEGTELYEKFSKIKANICPTCGQEVKSDSIIEYKNSLWKKIEELVQRREILKQHEHDFKKMYDDLGKISSELKRLITEKDQILGTIKEIEILNRKKSEAELGIDRIKKEESIIVIPEKVNLPDNFLELMSILDSKIQIWNSWSQLLEDKKKVEQDLFIAQENIEKVKVGENLFEKYIKLTSTTGKIYEEIMNRLSKEFSDNQVKYEVVTYNFRKKDHLDLASYYNKSGQWVSYNSASSGQKTILDVNFLSKIVTRLGILVMDEFLKSLDPENHDVCIEMITGMNVGCIMLSSHMESIQTFNNKTMNLNLNDSGLTTIKLE